MRIAIMQPYLFPYLGYFQLMEAADKFILLDDVNYIKRGWVNRNNILLQHKPYRFTLPLQKASQLKKINEIYIAADGKWKMKFMATLYMAYHRSAFYGEVADLVKSIIYSDATNLAIFLQNGLEKVTAYIGMKSPVIDLSSNLTEIGLKGQEKILQICRVNNAMEYVNLPGGKQLYQAEDFTRESVRLLFIEPHLPAYPQPKQEVFLAGLSIIDVLMNNSRESTQKMISDYAVISA